MQRKQNELEMCYCNDLFQLFKKEIFSFQSEFLSFSLSLSPLLPFPHSVSPAPFLLHNPLNKYPTSLCMACLSMSLSLVLTLQVFCQLYFYGRFLTTVCGSCLTTVRAQANGPCYRYCCQHDWLDPLQKGSLIPGTRIEVSTLNWQDILLSIPWSYFFSLS